MPWRSKASENSGTIDQCTLRITVSVEFNFGFRRDAGILKHDCPALSGNNTRECCPEPDMKILRR
jgi:hypothetical protein